MALIVKAYLLTYLLTYPQQQEIRRFTIDEGSSSNYDYLLTKIRTVFPDIRNKPLRLFWKDEDEELVSFSSHEELAGVLGSMKGDVFRVFIKVIDGQEESANQDGCNIRSSPEPVDQGVGCNGCDVGIAGKGFRGFPGPHHGRCRGSRHGFGCGARSWGSGCGRGRCGRCGF